MSKTVERGDNNGWSKWYGQKEGYGQEEEDRKEGSCVSEEDQEEEVTPSSEMTCPRCGKKWTECRC